MWRPCSQRKGQRESIKYLLLLAPGGSHPSSAPSPPAPGSSQRGIGEMMWGEWSIREFTVGAFWSTWGECSLRGARMLSGSLGCSKEHGSKVHWGEKRGFCSICGLFNILTEDLTNAGWTGGSPCWNIYLFWRYKQMLLRSLAADHQQEWAIGALLVYLQSKLARSDLLYLRRVGGPVLLPFSVT